jgi:pimeloyl-ACP methyl ester carboxylesterase
LDRKSERIGWTVDGERVSVGITLCGSGPALLLLPALSSISTRNELLPLQERLGTSFSTLAIDWPGFGEAPRPPMAWRPDNYRAFLRFLLADAVRPVATIAAGHAAGYVMEQAADNPASTGRLCLLSPTWRGPLPTMAGRRLALFRWLAKAVDLPVVGQGLYRLNVNGPVIRMMTRGHVYADPDWPTPQRMAEKRAVTEAAGARHASFRFVAGELDPFTDRAAFLDCARRVRTGMLVAYAKHCPRKSKAEMIELSRLDNVESVELPRGKLSFYEEFPDDTAEVVKTFLARGKI